MILKSIFVFICTFIIDVIYAKYYLALSEKNAMRASLWAGSLYFFTATVVVNYTENHWLIIPSVIGAFAGTYVTLKYFSK
jgi:hypothetical protein